MYTTDMYTGVFAETISMPGANGDWITAYLARPLGKGPFPAMVLAHHMPGWDQWYREATFRFADHGYITITPNLYFRTGHGTPEDVAARVHSEGGIPDDQAVADLAGARQLVRSLPYSNSQVGVFGTCSGGRHAYLAACRASGFDAVVDCWGGRVVMEEKDLSPKNPVSPLDYTPELGCPILGIFGNNDSNPSPEQVNRHEAELQKYHKIYEFHRYDDAGHGFFYYHRPAYRPEQATDGWQKIFTFLEKHLSA